MFYFFYKIFLIIILLAYIRNQDGLFMQCTYHAKSHLTLAQPIKCSYKCNKNIHILYNKKKFKKY